LEYNANFRLVDFEDNSDLSSNAVFLGQGDTDELQNTRAEVIASVPQQLHIYPSTSQLTATE